MDFDTIFTETESQALFNKCQLRYDPGHFTFKPRLLFTKYRPDLQIKNIDYDAELELLRTINTRMLKGDYVLTSFKHIVNITKPCYMTYAYGYNQADCTFVHKNNYYIDLSKLELDMRSAGRGTKYDCTFLNSLKASKFFEAFVTFMIASTHYSTIVPHLKWLCSTQIDEDYESVIEMKKLQENLKNKEFTDSCNTFQQHSIEACPNTPAISLADTAFVIDNLDDAKIQLWDFIVFALETFRNIESIPDVELKTILYDSISISTTENPITQLLYTKDTAGKVVLTKDVLTIAAIKNKEIRYNAIKDFVKEHTKDIEDAAKILCSTKLGINPMLCEFVKFCQMESIMNIRIKTIYILYNYIKDNGWLNDIDKDDFQDSMGDLGFSADTFEDLDNDMSKTSSLMNLDFAKYDETSFDKKDVESDTGSPKTDSGNSFYEELDKLVSDFSSGGYTFNVKDISATDDTSKAKYMSVVDNMSLLNANLTRSIKEIKVYNTGGKNPGKKSGKLDRKNLYKYRTSKDIFFDNTYKIKESDLAFGIILDVSGSMYGDGIKNGRTTMIVLHETLKALNINHSIITHTSDRHHNSIIDRYQSFKEDKTFNCNKNYALANIKSHGGNCDSGALYYMEQAMRRVKNKDKIVVIFSDGEPTECTGTELKDQVRHMEKNGIKVIGVGIDFPSIKEYYRNNANGKNLKEMFDIVSNILKEYVLEKIDKE